MNKTVRFAVFGIGIISSVMADRLIEGPNNQEIPMTVNVLENRNLLQATSAATVALQQKQCIPDNLLIVNLNRTGDLVTGDMVT